MPCSFFKDSFFLKKISVCILSTTYSLQQHDSKAIAIYFNCHWHLSMPLWCNISPCASKVCKGFCLTWLQQLCQSKVRDFCTLVFIHEYVLRFYVTMNDLWHTHFMEIKNSSHYIASNFHFFIPTRLFF